MAFQRLVVIRYAEIALKGRNRSMFIRQLEHNLKDATAGAGVRGIGRGPNRVFLFLEQGFCWDELAARLATVCGVRNFSLALKTKPQVEAILEAFRSLMPGGGFSSFRIRVQRSDKSLPMTSKELEETLGAIIKSESGARVDLSNATGITFYAEILAGAAYCYTERLPGLGGLPVGVGGRVVTLISGGIDSPVAAFRVMKRGCQVTFVHFHAFPYLDASTRDKTIALVHHLTRYQYRSQLYLVPFGDVQQQVAVSVPVPLRVVIYRRLMLRIAQEIARRQRALALVTGESLGQVASQTLENMVSIGEAVDMPVLRPLIGMDKEEIIREAQSIGTYETSIEPDQDCCTLFVPRFPATRSTVEQVRAAEESLDVETLVQQALAAVETMTFHWPEGVGSVQEARELLGGRREA